MRLLLIVLEEHFRWRKNILIGGRGLLDSDTVGFSKIGIVAWLVNAEHNINDVP